MTTLTHPQLVAALVKPPHDIIVSLTAFSTDLWHGATGVAGESGELLEALVLGIGNEYKFDRVNLREELGDLYFYMEQIVQRSGVVIDWDSADSIARQAIISPDRILHVGADIAIHGAQVLDTIKKVALYNKGLDLELLTNQMTALAASTLTLGYMFGIPRQEALDANVQKLSKRYASLSYSDTAAQERADKQTGSDTDVIPARKPFKGEEDTRAHTAGVTQPLSPRTSDMDDIAEASKRA